ncbi:hypothetical protein P872_17360 [Rhodonellum psychrophilum GCM71 = DSM 17998]|uniref:Aldehyde oxidase/xanthine dehydrogenase a/b hammerhead domain-containing protein n=2 Tax=Rhodonellum TaxID=336827 RepID=U5C2G0_9BACT|nr:MULTISPECIES: molybdopterin cofactor-binding domain-containing protein [Rhodonellum]ERM83116.1 hypothetical protein P872_17360 [Rhodonellum psychrophilum GCM71 = DSM 17998]SDY98165.1 CO or xanthine dehydrogenase, Mo-binding subunit [Rhodonellum ikkaensis]
MTSPNSPNSSRRSFLKNTGQLLIGFNLLPLTFCQSKSEILDGGISSGSQVRSSMGSDIIDSWIRLDAEGKVTVLTGKMELGQGIRTALMQMAAEELDVNMDIVTIINGDTGQTADEGYTAGSGTIERSGASIRKAAAEAKFFMVNMASEKWDESPENLSVKNGLIQSKNGKHKISYWELLDGKFLEGKVTGNAPLKNPKDHTLVGKGILREDIRKMAQGEAFFVHDLRLPEMVHARVLRPPSYGSILIDLDKESVLALPGVLKLVVDGRFIAVIAKREYQAIKALEFLKSAAKWQTEPLSPQQADLFSEMKKKSLPPQQVEEAKHINTIIGNSPQILEATYLRPYQMHASAGPSCAVAEWKDGKLTVWTPTQGVYPLRSTLSDFLGIDTKDIRCIGLPGSGCYGHNGADDVSADAAFIARSFPGKPVRVQWMREDEHAWEPYGSAMLLKLKAGLDASGKITGWDCGIWSDTHSTRPGGKAGHFIAARHLEKPFEFQPGGFSGGSYRNSSPLYNIPSKNIVLHNYKGPLRTSALRGLGAYGNIFALESFMDELANLAAIDPFEFRIKNLDNPRAIEVIKTLKSKCNWENRDQSGRVGYGLAFAQYKNSASYFAVVAEIHKSPTGGKFRLHKLTGVIDSGQCINPDGLKNQTEGGMIQSASWTIMEAVQYDANGITSKDWNSYPIMRTNDVPEVEVHIIDRPKEKPLGAGEAAQGPVAAAIVNALSSLLDKRVYELPLKDYFV